MDHISELEKMFESEFDYKLERENMEKVRLNVLQRWGGRRWSENGLKRRPPG